MFDRYETSAVFDRYEASAVFARAHRMPDGLRVRLRLARSGDQWLISGLLERLGFEPSTRRLLELVRFAPRQRAAICATALVDGTERVIGFGLVDLDAPRSPAMVLGDPRHGHELTRLIREALDTRRRVPAGA